MNASFSEAAPQIDYETYSSREDLSLPLALFHATTAENAERITQEGLKPNESIPGYGTAVCLSDTIGYAKFCASIQQETEPDELVIFEVDTQGFEPGTYTSWLYKDNPYKPGVKQHEVQTTVPIPPGAVHLLPDTLVHKIESQER